MRIFMRMQHRQRLQPLLMLLMVDKPTRALGEKENQGSKNNGRDYLNPQRNPPLSIVLHIDITRIGNPPGHQRAYAQHELVQSRDSATDGRMGDFTLGDWYDHGKKSHS